MQTRKSGYKDKELGSGGPKGRVKE